MNKDEIEKVVRENFPLENARPNQIEIIRDILFEFLENDERNVILSAPTGSGKSVIAWTVAKVISQIFDPTKFKLSQYGSWSFKTTLMTANRNLQKQYVDDFPVDNLWGKTNYHCQHGTHYNSGDCYALRKNLECSTDVCAYHIARRSWLSSQLRLTNMSFQIEACDTITNKVRNRASLIVIDECHNLGAQIQNHCAAVFSKEEFAKNQKYLTKKIIERVDGYIDKINTIINTYTSGDVCKIPETEKEVFSDLMDYAEASYKALKSTREAFDSKKELKEILAVTDTINHLGELSDLAELVVNNLNQPVLNEKGTLRPIFPGSFAYYALYRKADKFLHMSATICNPESYAREAGIRKYVYLEMPNEIPVNNRQVIVSSIQRVSNSKLSDDMLTTIDGIVEENELLNGVIHTTSYSRAKEILEGSFQRNRMFISSDKEEIMEKMSNQPGAVLVSPYAYEGLDFKDDLARFQIITKVPYESTQDKLNELVFKLNKSLYFRRAIVKTVQAAGRASRHKDDFSATYILDSAFYDLLKYNRSVFPVWFRDALLYKKKADW